MLLVGLGNPGSRYEKTRHNVGFRVVDELRRRFSCGDYREKFEAHYCQCEVQADGATERLVLLKPQTYMNLSGRSVRPAAAFFKEKAGRVLVIHDELDLPLGRLQLKLGGGSGGHNGLKSVTAELGSSDYLRLRIGIGRPPGDFRGEIADFVLQGFPPEDLGLVDDQIAKAASAVELLVTTGISNAMNQVNRRPL